MLILANLTKKIEQNRSYSVATVILIATISALAFHWLFVGLVINAITNSKITTANHSASLLISLLIAAAFLYLFMVIAIAFSGIFAWLVMRIFHVPKAGKITLFSNLV